MTRLPEENFAVHAAGAPERNGRGRRRAAFFISLIAGLLLMLACASAAVVYNALRMDLFETAVDRCLVQTGVLDPADAQRFSVTTIGFLNGDLPTWAPEVTVNGQPLTVPEAFALHMAQVRDAIRFARAAVIGGAALALALLLGSGLTGRGQGRGSGFSAGGYYAGALVPLLALAGLWLWGMADFNAFWAWLHYTLIPGGIFNAHEPVMRLFPEALFALYAQPVAISMAAGAAGLLLWPAVARGIGAAIRHKRGARL